jgi:hypothetical protein
MTLLLSTVDWVLGRPSSILPLDRPRPDRPECPPRDKESAMTGSLFNERDVKQIQARGMTPEHVLGQIDAIKRGFPPAELDRPCKAGDGIVTVDASDIARFSDRWDDVAGKGRAMKFVPASGAASRMFKLLQSVWNRQREIREEDVARRAEAGDPEEEAFLQFLRGVRKFAFFDDLCSAMARDGIDADKRISEGRYDEILEYLLTPKGLDAANLPKGLIPFHAYPDGSRTPFEEHLVEAVRTVRDNNGRVRLHVTGSPEHEGAIRDHLGSVRARYEHGGTRFDLEVSVQMPQTDTIALDLEDRPFRDEEGRLLFRPGGHGAILENLDRLGGDVVIVKNIDNVVPDRLKGPTVTYKKVLGGYLVTLQEEIFRHVQTLVEGTPDAHGLERIWTFAVERLGIQPPNGLKDGTGKARRDFLLSQLNRPLRVCGMVKNEGEPGGGPFWVRYRGGGVSRQIVESSQVDMDSEEQKAIWNASTHFNPVDLMCGLRDFMGRPFDLHAFLDPESGFVSIKSKGGRELKALELPGLWNGAMAWWLTVFVEVPIVTFNPVKTVLDLLRKEHQPA